MSTTIRVVRDTSSKGRFTVFGVRLAYASDLITPRAMKKDDGSPGVPRYSGTILIPESAQEAIKEIQSIMWEVAQAQWGAQAEAVWRELTASNKLALKSGNLKASQEGFPGNVFISANAKLDRAPALFHKWLGPDGRPQQLERPTSVIYSGCYANVQLSLWAQNNAYGKRINADVLAVQFAADGPAFAGSGGVDSSVFGGEAPPAGAAFGAPPAAPSMPPSAPTFSAPPSTGSMGAFAPARPPEPPAF